LSPAERFSEALAGQSLAKPEIEAKDFTMPPVGPRVSIPRSSDDWRRFSAMETLLAHEPPEAKETSRWRFEMEKYVALTNAWSGEENENPTDYYVEKWDLLHNVLRIQTFYQARPRTGAEVTEFWRKHGTIPRAEIPGRERVMLDLADFLDSSAGSAVYNQRRIQWFATVWQTLGPLDRSEQTIGFASLHVRAHNLVLNMYGNWCCCCRLRGRESARAGARLGAPAPDRWPPLPL
jgi:hypothetical protein